MSACVQEAKTSNDTLRLLLPAKILRFLPLSSGNSEADWIIPVSGADFIWGLISGVDAPQ